MAPKQTRKADGPDLSTDPNAFISVNPPSGVERDEQLGPVRVTRGAFDAWMKDAGWSEVADSASFDPSPPAVDDDNITNLPPPINNPSS